MKKTTKTPATTNALAGAKARASQAKDAVGLALTALVLAFQAEAKKARAEKDQAEAVLAALPAPSEVGEESSPALSQAIHALADQVKAQEELATVAEAQAQTVAALSGKKPRKGKKASPWTNAPAGPAIIEYRPGGRGVAYLPGSDTPAYPLVQTA